VNENVHKKSKKKGSNLDEKRAGNPLNLIFPFPMKMTSKGFKKDQKRV
jgi:hypothetical protein